jgi:hypothetical protein
MALTRIGLNQSINLASNVTGTLPSGNLPAGSILQVVTTTKSDTFQATLSGGNFSDITGLSASITPATTSSKIFVTCSINYGNFGSSTYPSVFRLYRDSTLINTGTAEGNRLASSTAPMQQGQNADKNRGMHATINFLDSPSTTSATTYKINGGMLQGSGTLMVNTSGTSFDVNETYITRSASTITLMEIAG